MLYRAISGYMASFASQAEAPEERARGNDSLAIRQRSCPIGFTVILGVTLAWGLLLEVAVTFLKNGKLIIGPPPLRWAGLWPCWDRTQPSWGSSLSGSGQKNWRAFCNVSINWG